MRQFFTVLRFELENYFKNKSFVVTTVILMVVFSALLVVPPLIPGLLKEKDPKPVSSVESTGSEERETEVLGIVYNTADKRNFKVFLENTGVIWKEYNSKKTLENAVENNRLDAGFVMNGWDNFTYVVKNRSMSDSRSEMFSQILSRWNKEKFYQSLMDRGISKEEIADAERFQVTSEELVLGKDSVNNYAYTYILIFAIYFLILFYGQMIAVSVTNEKSNRAIEILVTSVNSNSLIIGKVIAGALSGIVQMGLILGSGMVSYHFVKEKWGEILDVLFDIPAKIWIAYIFFGLLSYLLYSLIFGALGALVSKTEDISKSATPVTLIYVVSFFIAIFGMNSSDSMLMKVASFIPFTSGNAMFIRISMGNTQIWEILLSGAILLLTCGLAGWITAKIYRYGTLNYGNPIKLSKAIKDLKTEL